MNTDDGITPTDAQFTLPTIPINIQGTASFTDNYAIFSAILREIASGNAVSKTAIAHTLDLSRPLISSRIDTLVSHGLVELAGVVDHTGRGRPAHRLALSPQAGIILIADIGARHAKMAAVGLDQTILASSTARIDISAGPETTLNWVATELRRLHSAAGSWRRVQTVTIGLPARLDNETRVPVRPGIMPGWDGFDVMSPFETAFKAPVVIENDANLIAIGEAALLSEDQFPLVAIKVATGVGAGLIDSRGRISYGFDGAAGEIGHIPVRRAPAVRCSCGTEGCVEAVASIPSMINTLRTLDPTPFSDESDDLDTFVGLLQEGNQLALQVVREAAECLGEAVAILCNTLNPRRILITGELTEVTDELLAGIRAVTYQNARPLATRNLLIRHSLLGSRAGIAGGIVLGLNRALSPEALQAML